MPTNNTLDSVVMNNSFFPRPGPPCPCSVDSPGSPVDGGRRRDDDDAETMTRYAWTRSIRAAAAIVFFHFFTAAGRKKKKIIILFEKKIKKTLSLYYYYYYTYTPYATVYKYNMVVRGTQ